MSSINNKKRKASQAVEQEHRAKKQKQIQPDRQAAKQSGANEIEDIFSKSNNNASKAAAVTKKMGSKPKPSAPATSQKQSTRASNKEDDDVFWKDSRGNMNSNRKYTEEGLPIYSEDELKIGKGGETPLCPFDCTCCY